MWKAFSFFHEFTMTQISSVMEFVKIHERNVLNVYCCKQILLLQCISIFYVIWIINTMHVQKVY